MAKAVERLHILWMSPSPLWGERSAWIRLPEQNQLTQPVILRFANDVFMDEMIAMLTHAPWRLTEWVARPETWRNPMPTPKPVEISRPPVNQPTSYNSTKSLVRNYSRDTRMAQIKSVTKTPGAIPNQAVEEPIKLYQAAHQRYYVVTGSLVSEKKGYPDYLINLSARERATFVVRALVDDLDGTTEEYGFVATPTGMAWRKAGTHTEENAAVLRVLANEERLPLFPVTYPDRCDRLRQVFGGLIPVNKRDEWVDAPAFRGQQDVEIAGPVPASDGGDELFREILYSDVIAPWKALIDQAETDKRKSSSNEQSFPNFTWNETAAQLDQIRAVRTARDEIQTSSWYVLLDFASFLRDHLPNIWQRLGEVQDGSQADSTAMTLTEDEMRLVDILLQSRMDIRLFVALAIENLAVGGFTTQVGGAVVSLWDRVIDFWKFEIFLKLSWVLYASEFNIEKLNNKVATNPWLSVLYKQTFLAFLGSFAGETTGSQITFLDFAQKIGTAYPALKTASVQGIAPSASSDDGRLITILEKIKLPLIQGNVVAAMSEENVPEIELSKSIWDLLTFYWAFETHVDQKVGEKVAGDVAAYISAQHVLDDKDLQDQLMQWFSGEVGESLGNWYSFFQFTADLEVFCPILHAAAMREIFDKQAGSGVTDDVTGELISTLQAAEITGAMHNELYYPNTEKRKIRIIRSLADALVEIVAWADKLEEVDVPYDRNIQSDGGLLVIDERWPDFLFPLTDPEPSLGLEESHLVPKLSSDSKASLDGTEYLQDQLDQLADLIDGLVRVEKQQSGDGTSSVLHLTPLLDNKKARFVVRFVFEKPQCGNLFQPLVSRATCQLEMAPFFDPDAPARPVRIRMPLDISPAGLRKYKKNAMVLFSDLLCGKMKKIKKITLADLVLSVLPWPFHKDLPDIGKTGPCRKNGETMGMFCSLSIPIVTLCALILLTIMVSLFNIFFKWIPWFFMCFPLPGLSGLKGKDKGGEGP